MKIQYVSGSAFPSEISHTLSKMRMCQAFSDAGHDVLLTAIDAGKEQDQIKFYGLKGGFKISLQKTNLLINNRFTRKFHILNFINSFFHLRNIKQFKPDAIYSRLTILELLFLPNDIPILYEMHSLGPFGKGFFAKTFFKLVLKLKNFRKIIVSSNILLKMLEEHIKDIEIIAARLSAEEPVEIKEIDLENFKKKNLLGDKFLQHVGYTGYLDLIGLRGTDIICKVASQMPNVAFHIVGGKPEIVEHWKDYSTGWNTNRNIFFYGHRNPLQIPFFLKCFDVVLAPLQFKPISRAPTGANMSPLKLPQYMAYKKAMVVSDLNAHQEILNQDITAMFVDFKDVNSWKNNIEKLLLSPEKRIEMGENCYKEYLLKFTPEGRVKIILNNINV
jgi:glycosyltransferase involved in cell wall biosynthesis